MTAYSVSITEAAAAADTDSSLATLPSSVSETAGITESSSSSYSNRPIPPVNQPAPLSGTPPTAPQQAADKIWVRHIAERLNAALGGKLNVVLSVVLTPGAATTTVIDSRIGPFSGLIPLPATANAAAACYETPYILPSSQKDGSVVLNHVNDANTDKIITLVIIG